MKNEFKEIKAELISDNPFKLIGSDWMLITAGTIDNYNTMTASWGGLGVLWHKKIAFCVIKSQRYTRQFMEKNNIYTLSFFENKYKKALTFCGTHSGKDVNKAEEAGITPLETPSGAVSFTEARLILECKKIYYQDINPDNFLDPAIDKNYPDKDYHRMYVGEIIKCLSK